MKSVTRLREGISQYSCTWILPALYLINIIAIIYNRQFQQGFNFIEGFFYFNRCTISVV